MSKRKRLAIVDFSEVFHFAKDNHEVGWNAANDLFFDTIFRYKGSDEFSQDELEEQLVELEQEEDSDHLKARRIMLEFMKKERLKECLVISD